MSRPVPVVTEQLLYNKIAGSISAVTTEQIFIPVNGTSFSYHGTNEIRIRLATPVENAFLDDRHSVVRMTVENPNTFPIYFDTLSSSFIKSVRIESGGVALENTNNYNALMNLLLEHFSSNEFNNEMALLSGFTNVPLKAGDKLDLKKDGGKNYGTNVILPNGGSRQICIPLISALLKTKLIPLCFLGNSFLEIILTLEDGRVAFLCDGECTTSGGGATTYNVPDASARDIKYSVSGVEYVSTIISIRNNEMVGALGKQLLSDGLFFCGKSYTCYNNIIPSTASSPISFNIPDKSQSLAYIISACYLAQGDPRFSNLQSGLYGTTSIQYQVGSEYMPRTRPISYTSDNVIQPYLQLQKVSSNGFFSTNNSTSITLNSFSRQSPNTILDFGSTAYDLSTGKVANHVRPSSFCNAYSFQNFHNLQGNAEVGLNTVTLSLPLTINLSRDPTTYYDLEGKYLDNVTGSEPTDKTKATKAIPLVNFLSWCVSDTIWKLTPSGTFEVMR